VTRLLVVHGLKKVSDELPKPWKILFKKGAYHVYRFIFMIIYTKRFKLATHGNR